ncbi:MAG: hypothetical protein VR74_17510 [Hyphomonas sp. BRH_c22]|uniref:hypothetical protein n=1 Tax=Hyphomonas sp. BRH_c22 TaxID=1629710 RepID=UPI0005F14752|nr:hypothetical protein [Hyphomonas sp. BRH_c22]KJS35160.1 MAG: hypothetical protein VR74_17510 [Hyphomonas sp. BRH_c22]
MTLHKIELEKPFRFSRVANERAIIREKWRPVVPRHTWARGHLPISDIMQPFRLIDHAEYICGGRETFALITSPYRPSLASDAIERCRTILKSRWDLALVEVLPLYNPAAVTLVVIDESCVELLESWGMVQ